MAGVSQPILDWTRDMAMVASPRATLECVTAFGTADFTGDVSRIRVPTLIIHGTSDKTIPIAATAQRLAKMLPDARLIEYGGAPHGLTATHADQLVEDLLEFLGRRDLSRASLCRPPLRHAGDLFAITAVGVFAGNLLNLGQKSVGQFDRFQPHP